ncbi:MAG: RHS repeat-associated core domain-containing protein [Pseudomonadota bacterium]
MCNSLILKDPTDISAHRYFYYFPDQKYTRITDPKGYRSDHYYNDTGNPTTTQTPDSKTSARTWDAEMNMTSFTDPNGNTTNCTYDSKGNLLTITDPQGSVTKFTYEPTYSQVASITDALGRVTLFESDAKGNLTKRTDAAGNETTYTYNASGDLLTITNAAGTTHFGYDTYGYATVITDPLGKQTSLSYDILGNITSSTDRNGNATQYEYDKLNKLILSKNALGVITKLEYDANGNLTGTMDWLPPPMYDPSPVTVYTYTYTYNNYDQLATVADILNKQIFLTYDANGNLATVRDGEGNTTSYDYDKLDRLIKTVDPLNHSTQYTYDPNGHLTKTTDAGGNAVSYTYDNLNRLLQTQYPDASTVNYAYNKVGRLISKTDQKGNTIGYNYDNLNRLTAKTYPDASHATYTYDALGRLTSAVDEDSTVGFAYDALSRLVQSIQNGKTVSYEYDNMANKTKLTYPDGNYTTFTYDALNRLDQVKNALGHVLGDYTYIDRIDRTTRKYIDLGNGTRPDYMYDEINRLTSLTTTLTSAGDVLSKFAYTYDKNHNALSMATLQGTHSYSYDKISQLTGVDYPAGYSFSDTTYSFDPVGNRVSNIRDGVTTAYASNNLNEYTSVGGTTLACDANGNLVSDGVNTYSYDYDNRLVQVGTLGDTISFAYDALGRRISKTSLAGTTRYIYDGYQSVVETDASGTVKAAYVYGTGIDEALTVTRNGGTYYYHYDGLGSVVGLTDSTGAIVEQYQYDVYGQPAIYDGAGNAIPQSAIGNSYMFTGREFDKETGIYYYRARYYSPQLGRFLQRDPLTWAPDDPRVIYLSGFRINMPRLYERPPLAETLARRIVQTGQMNVELFQPYTYCQNNAANWVDPEGMRNWGTAAGQALEGAAGNAIGYGADAIGMAGDTSGNGGYYGGAVCGAVGAVTGGLVGGPPGGFAGGIIGGAVGGEIGCLFDNPGAGQLNYGEDYDLWRQEAKRKGYIDMF